MALMDFGDDRASAVETVSVILDLLKNSLWCTLLASERIWDSMAGMWCLMGLLSSVFSFSMTSVVTLDVRSTEGSGQDILICVHGFGVSWLRVRFCVDGEGVDVFCGDRDGAVEDFVWLLLGVIV